MVAGGRRRPSDGRKADGSAASSGWAESLGADGIRLVTELDEQFGRLLDERGRTADEDARPPAGRGSDRPEHLRVDPPRESAPVRGWIACEREVDDQPVSCEFSELVAIQRVIERAGREEHSRLDPARVGGAMAEHRDERHKSRPAGDQQYGETSPPSIRFTVNATVAYSGGEAIEKERSV